MIKVGEKYRISPTDYLRICKDANGLWVVERYQVRELPIVFVGTLKECREMVKREHGRYLLLGGFPNG